MKLIYITLSFTILFSSSVFSLEIASINDYPLDQTLSSDGGSSDIFSIKSYADLEKASTCILKKAPYAYVTWGGKKLICDGVVVGTTSTYPRSPYMDADGAARFTAVADILIKFGFIYVSDNRFIKKNRDTKENSIVKCQADSVDGDKVIFICGEGAKEIPLGTQIELKI